MFVSCFLVLFPCRPSNTAHLAIYTIDGVEVGRGLLDARGGREAELVMSCGLNTKFGPYKFRKYDWNFSVYIWDPRIQSGIPSN